MIVLDTSFLIEFLDRNVAATRVVEDLEAKEEFAVSTVSLYELLQPAYHKKLEKSERVIKAMTGQTRLLSFDVGAADEAAKIMGALLRIGRPVNALDVMIAGSALSSDAKLLVSFDEDFKEIANVCNLRVEIPKKDR